jgi:UDP-N-acetylmuramate dehydrogenase
MLYSQAVQIQEHVSLAPLTTLRIGGPARYLARAESEADLLEALEFARRKGLPLFVLGGGSNLLVADQGFDGVVAQIGLMGAPVFEEGREWVLCTVAAGADWDGFVAETCRRGLTGVECLAGIPGLVGGTPVQNVGAYGQEVANTIVTVRALDLATSRFVTLTGTECGFAYRSSRFNTTHRGRYVVTAVTFRLRHEGAPNLSYRDLRQHFAGSGSVPAPTEVYHAVRSIRHAKGMLLVEGEPDCRSAGSFFKNPVVTLGTLGTLGMLERIGAAVGVPPEEVPNWPAAEGLTKLPAAWLVEKAGFHKGFALGAAGISSRHTLALINRGGATQVEMVALRDHIQETVYERFGVRLEQEPVMLP